MIDQTLQELSSTHGDRFVLQSSPEILGVWDCDAIKRMTENLASNAVKYGATYTPITITISETDEEVAFTVHNEGDPIPEAEQGALFKPYSRASSARLSGQKGWGLGLTLVQGMAEAHGGSVAMRSSRESGTSFAVTLPRRKTTVRRLKALAGP